MDQATGDPKDIFDAIVQATELSMAAREFDNVDHSNGDNVPNASQMAAAAEIMAAARELRRILGR